MPIAKNNVQPNLIRICVDTVSAPEPAGRCYSLYGRDPIVFGDLWELIRQCDALFDRIDYPQAAVERRRFFAAPRRRGGRPEAVCTSGELAQEKGSCASLFLAVNTRRGAGWQGRLTADSGEETGFTSELEFGRALQRLLHQQGAEPAPAPGDEK